MGESLQENTEKFHVISDFPDYMVGSNGSIYSIRKNKIMSHNVKKSGYHEVGLRYNKKRYFKRVSRLVYQEHGEYSYKMKGLEVDHQDRDRDNNSINNLRLATKSENETNKVKRKGCSSNYLGVHLHRDNRWKHDEDRWRSDIKVNNKKFVIGVFKNEINSAYAYDQVAKHIKNTDFYINFSAENLELPENDENRQDKIDKAITKINNWLSQQ